MKPKKIAVMMLFLAALLGCVSPPPQAGELPEDFRLEYGSGAMHLEWGAYYLTVENGGESLFTKTSGFDERKEIPFKASEGELLEIYNAALANNFFALNSSYTDPSIMDGGWSEISITANGSTHSVSMNNYSMQQFDAVEEKIVAMIKANLGQDAFSLEELE